ncbi:hypothetical protein SAMN02744133_108172 [Thalassospira xiamenensis M-5 = DSM 17429]|uniref:Uncharacterized protein n=1 Tax=Thalassospira xiamenensis M-5 = DSM 17429 TaxID=1123366 RepID=A0AB72ULL6_9PROT|nr:hypothetical protein [Thalassospira xiamenensis]AJD54443.1 hypothetical protein TH3_21853 [Thalassospira xiamenensis M-5 = DSM 17429]SIT22231.1 hypothetical protein SAMN02744133_108172 [Thalassospira xiamenensis M-5 = DSM 17429]
MTYIAKPKPSAIKYKTEMDEVPVRHATYGVAMLYRSKPGAQEGTMEINNSRLTGFRYEGLFYSFISDEVGAACYRLNDTFISTDG